MRTLIGIEQLAAEPYKWPLGKRLGLLANPASVDGRLRHTIYLLNEALPGRLTTLFSPQHGFFSEKQDNMIASADTVEPILKLPVYSLYGKTLRPTPEMMADIDTLIIDLQDVGTRVYTFIYTMAYCMEAAKQQDLPVVVLDRPNPVNGTAVEGNLLVHEYASFVGRYPLPMRHGLTIGEMARFFNDYFEINCRLDVVPLNHWQRHLFFNDTGLTWVAPSPNLPTPISALVYPGQVVWEGTNVSEGRGTTQPFELFGAPFIDPWKILQSGELKDIGGTVLRPAAFEPVAGKWSRKRCLGFQIHPVDPDRFQPYRTSLKLLQTVMTRYPDDFSWQKPPYEFEYKKRPVDLILGDAAVRRQLEEGKPVDDLEANWTDALEKYKNISRQFYLY